MHRLRRNPSECFPYEEYARGNAMNWEAISAISDTISALAVVVTLGYLAFQVRQNTKQLEQNERTSRAASVSASATTYRENRQHIYTSAEVAKIQLKGMAEPESLDEVDRYRFRLLMSNFMDANWDMYAQTAVTGLSPETWEAQGRKAIVRVLGSPGGRWFWQDFCEEYPESFRVEVDRILASSSIDEKRSPEAL
jgi:hypothetical protein